MSDILRLFSRTQKRPRGACDEAMSRHGVRLTEEDAGDGATGRRTTSDGPQDRADR